MYTTEQKMKTNLKYLILNIIVVLVLCGVSQVASAQLLGRNLASDERGVVVDKIIAKVDNYIILKSEVERAYLEYLSRGQFSSGDAKCRIFESLVINKLLVAKAEIDSVEVGDDEVESNLERRFSILLAQIGGTEADIERYYNKTIQEFKDDLRTDVKEQLIVQRMQSTITEGIDITPAEVKKFFKGIPSDSLPFFSKEVEVAQIVKNPTVSKSQKDKVKAELLRIRQTINSEADFEAAAKKYSQDPGSAARGGNYGYQRRGAFVPEYEAAVFKMKPLEISEPVETEYGFHLIQLIDRRGNEYNSRHILLTTTPSADDLKDAEGYLDSLKTVIAADSVSFEKAASEHSDDQQTSGSGGFFLNSLGSSYVAIDELDPVIFFTIDTMDIGQITKPISFRSDDGKEAARIIYFRSFKKAHQANLSQDYQKIQAAALTNKRNIALSKWFSDAQGDVFIEIDDELSYCKILN